jgi:hypothetical protein
MVEMRGAYKVLVGKHEGKRPVGRLDWMNVAQNRDQLRALVNTVMNLRASQKAGNILIR